MALNTRAKRFSMMNHVIRGPGIAFLLPEADGSDMDGGDERAQMMGLYGGIAFGAPSAAAGPPYDVQAGDMFLAGGVAAQLFIAGGSVGEPFVAGGTIGEIDV